MKLSSSLFIAALCVWSAVVSRTIYDNTGYLTPYDSQELIDFVLGQKEARTMGQKWCNETNCCPGGFRCVNNGLHCFSFPWYIKSIPCE